MLEARDAARYRCVIDAYSPAAETDLWRHTPKKEAQIIPLKATIAVSHNGDLPVSKQILGVIAESFP